MNTNRDELGDVLRRAIADSGLTLNRIARRSGVEYGSLWRIAKAGADPRLSTVSRLAPTLGLTVTIKRAKTGEG
jgi:DNA-binding phage protein